MFFVRLLCGKVVSRNPRTKLRRCYCATLSLRRLNQHAQEVVRLQNAMEEQQQRHDREVSQYQSRVERLQEQVERLSLAQHDRCQQREVKSAREGVNRFLE